MPKFNKHVIIVGTARSGTSWLSETMAQKRRYRMLFEPEQETRTKLGHLLCDQWLTKPSDSQAAHKYLNQVFANRVDCDWIAQNSNRKFKMHLWSFVPKKFIIKFVRCNLSAHYMNIYFGIPVIHIIRNPYEVLASQSRVNFPWLQDMSHFIKQQKLVNYIKEKFGFNLRNLENYNDLQLKTIRWCIENLNISKTLQEAPSKTYKVIKYENLVKDITVFYELCQQFDVDYIENIESLYKLPSTKAHSNGTVSNAFSRTPSFNKKELESINEILDIFETKSYPIIRE